VLPKIFDPFFTTTSVGKGTRQGLPLVRAIVQEGHGGILLVDSESGSGEHVHHQVAGRRHGATGLTPLRGQAAASAGHI
jgi:signal transduction histidine kinase